MKLKGQIIMVIDGGRKDETGGGGNLKIAPNRLIYYSFLHLRNDNIHEILFRRY